MALSTRRASDEDEEEMEQNERGICGFRRDILGN